jgi:hypothetical protein
VAIACLSLAGLVLRLWILGRQPITPSTVIPGLMAHQILNGHFSAFYWGQNYGGLEPYVVAAIFAVFGQSAFTLGLAPLVLDAVAALLVWRIGRRLFGPGIGAGAALLFWIWPEVYLYESTMEYGFRYATLVCGLAVMLLALRIGQRDGRRVVDSGWSRSGLLGAQRADWAALGLFAGLGWWGSPEIAYYVVPSTAMLVWMLLKRRIEFRPGLLALAVGGAVVGALPWLWVNARSHLGSLRHISHPQPGDSFTSHLSIFFTHTLPIVLGVRLRADPVTGRQDWVPGSGGFLVSPSGPAWVTALGVIAYLAGLAGLLIWTAVLIRRRRALVLVGAVLLYPFLFATSPFASDWHDGRYGLFLAPVMSLLVASAAVAAFERLGRPRLGLAATMVVASALTLMAVVHLSPYTPLRSDASRSGWFTWHTNPNPGAVHLTRSLEAAHLDHLWAGHLVSWLLDWESGGAIAASDVRYPNQDYYSEVARANAPGWLFVQPQKLASVATTLDIDPRILDPGCEINEPSLCVKPATLESFLATRHYGYRVVNMGPFLVVEPSKTVPASLIVAHQSAPSRPQASR